MSIKTLVDMAGGRQTIYTFPAGSTVQSIKVDGKEVAPKAISGHSVTLDEAPAHGAMVEITIDDNREISYCAACGQRKG